MDRHSLTGIITALATPFTKEGELDKKSFIKLLHWQMDQGVKAFVINGTTGESPCLFPQEVEQIFSWTKTETAGSAQLILGVGGNSTKKTLQNIKTAGRLKADSVLAVAPYYNKPSALGVLKHFQHLAKNSPLPIILYNVPSRTITEIDLETIKTLSQEPQIIGLKEASGDLTFGKNILTALKNFTVLSGEDDSFLDLCALGAKGVISVASHIIGRQMIQLLQQLQSGKQTALKSYKEKYGAFLNRLYAETNPIGIKTALKLKGLFSTAKPRLPLTEMSQENTKKLKTEMEKLGLL